MLLKTSLKSFKESVSELFFIRMHIYGPQLKKLMLARWQWQLGKALESFRYDQVASSVVYCDQPSSANLVILCLYFSIGNVFVVQQHD